MEHEFDRTPISKLVLKLGVPAMLAQFFNILYSIVDRAYVGHMETGGDIALASIGICAPVLTAITAFSSLVGIGGASFMSISIGRKDDRSACLAIYNANILLLCIAVMITILCVAFAKPLLYVLGCSDTMYPYASGYFKIYVMGTVAVLCGTGMNQFILAFGRAKRGMAAIMIGAIVNTILDPIFIYVFDLGINGAAIATVIAQFCVMFYVLSFLFSDQAPIRLRFFPLDGRIVRQIVTIGSLPFLIMVFDNLLIISLNFVLRKYGGELLGDQYISCAAAQSVPELFARIFIKDPDIIILSASFIRKYTLGLLGVAVQYAIVDGLTAMGQIRFAMPISFFRKMLYIACIFIFPLFWPLEDVFLFGNRFRYCRGRCHGNCIPDNHNPKTARKMR